MDGVKSIFMPLYIPIENINDPEDGLKKKCSYHSNLYLPVLNVSQHNQVLSYSLSRFPKLWIGSKVVIRSKCDRTWDMVSRASPNSTNEELLSYQKAYFELSVCKGKI